MSVKDEPLPNARAEKHQPFPTLEGTSEDAQTSERARSSRSPRSNAWPWTTLLLLFAALIALAVGRSYYRLQHPLITSTTGVASERNDLGRWGCGMSWMSPGYVRVPVRIPDRPSLERKYNLFLYREGGLSPTVNVDADGFLRPGKPVLHGQPVLFIPGNAGDFRQVRSVASSAAHQYAQGPWSGRKGYEDWARERAASSGSYAPAEGVKELEFFTLDLNEEFSALHAHTLHTQAEYTAQAVATILSLYGEGARVWLVGHSMGGIVARHAMRMILPGNSRPGNLVQDVVEVIVTISTPNTFPPVSFDRGMERIYSGPYDPRVLDSAAMAASLPSGSTAPTGAIMIALCGGLPDHQISSDGCPFARPPRNDVKLGQRIGSQADPGVFSVFTSGLELAWTGTDHNAAVWCEQVRWIVARALMEMTIPRKSGRDGEAAETPPRRSEMVKTARRWFLAEWDVKRPGATLSATGDGESSRLSPSAPTFENQFTSWRTYILNVSARDTPIELQIMQSTRRSDLEEGIESAVIVELCIDPTAQCQRVQPSEVRLLPPSKSAALGESSLWPRTGKGTHAGESMVWMTFAVLSSDTARSIRVRVHGPRWGVVGMTGDSTWRPILTRYSLPPASSLIARRVAFHRQVECQEPKHFAPLFEARLASAEDQILENYFTPALNTSTLVHLHSSSAPFLPGHGAPVDILVWQDPTSTCLDLDTALQVKIDWSASAGVMVVRYRMLLLAWTLGVALLIFGNQVEQFIGNGAFPSVHETTYDFVRQVLPVLGLSLVALSLLQVPLLGDTSAISSSTYLLGGVPPSMVILVVPLLALATGLVCVCSAVLSGICWTLSAPVRVIGFLQLSEPRSGSRRIQARHITTTLALLTLVAFLVPHQFAFVVAFVLHLSSATAAQAQGDPSRSNYYQSILLLLLLLLPMNTAILLVWARNLLSRWEVLQPFGADHNPLLVAPVLALVELCAGGAMVRPLASPNRSRLAAGPFYAAGAYAFVAGARYTYGIHDLTVVAVASLVLWHAMAPEYGLKRYDTAASGRPR